MESGAYSELAMTCRSIQNSTSMTQVPQPSTTAPPSVACHRAHPGVLAAIAVGGFLGTLGRYELTLAWPGAASGFPTATFVINTTGSVSHRTSPHRHSRTAHSNPLFAAVSPCVGLLGGWTTMSSLAVEADVLIKQGHALTALGYLGATVVAGVIAAALGIALGRVRTGAGLKGGHA